MRVRCVAQVDQIVQLRTELMELQEKLRVAETDKLALEGEIQVGWRIGALAHGSHLRPAALFTIAKKVLARERILEAHVALVSVLVVHD